MGLFRVKKPGKQLNTIYNKIIVIVYLVGDFFLQGHPPPTDNTGFNPSTLFSGPKLLENKVVVKRAKGVG